MFTLTLFFQGCFLPVTELRGVLEVNHLAQLVPPQTCHLNSRPLHLPALDFLSVMFHLRLFLLNLYCFRCSSHGCLRCVVWKLSPPSPVSFPLDHSQVGPPISTLYIKYPFGFSFCDDPNWHCWYRKRAEKADRMIRFLDFITPYPAGRRASYSVEYGAKRVHHPKSWTHCWRWLWWWPGKQPGRGRCSCQWDISSTRKWWEQWCL